MKASSFRLKIALLSVVISGLVLAGLWRGVVVPALPAKDRGGRYGDPRVGHAGTPGGWPTARISTGSAPRSSSSSVRSIRGRLFSWSRMPRVERCMSRQGGPRRWSRTRSIAHWRTMRALASQSATNADASEQAGPPWGAGGGKGRGGMGRGLGPGRGGAGGRVHQNSEVFDREDRRGHMAARDHGQQGASVGRGTELRRRSRRFEPDAEHFPGYAAVGAAAGRRWRVAGGWAGVAAVKEDQANGRTGDGPRSGSAHSRGSGRPRDRGGWSRCSTG